MGKAIAVSLPPCGGAGCREVGICLGHADQDSRRAEKIEAKTKLWALRKLVVNAHSYMVQEKTKHLKQEIDNLLIKEISTYM